MLLELLIRWIFSRRIYKITNAKYANDRNKALKMAVVRTNRLKSCRFTAILKFNKGISTIQGINSVLPLKHIMIGQTKIKYEYLFYRTVHETLIMSTYQKCLRISRHFCVRPEIAAFFERSDISNVHC